MIYEQYDDTEDWINAIKWINKILKVTNRKQLF